MNNWKPNYQTKAGVEVEAERGSIGDWNVYLRISEAEIVVDDKEMAALFEPIPRPKTVEIPLEVARKIWELRADGETQAEFLAAILAAEKEQAPCPKTK